jgi:Xaa-Pro aminopeptidase
MRDLRTVDECLRERCAAEQPGGTLADVEIAIGRWIWKRLDPAEQHVPIGHPHL